MKRKNKNNQNRIANIILKNKTGLLMQLIFRTCYETIIVKTVFARIRKSVSGIE